ncbi:glycosyltransferase family 2 protein [Lactococcus lactis subsp. lactis]|jgi:Glycosyltransferases involved in cell wall biogenesis|uniref:glycosyltransferase family 2 protein n=1 Tax=Lactococcus lactis TaxID=1358 RepID=UPI00223A8131|nr:glycosyltransferase family 2 protein [Lactococcus lactis]MCT0016662.1 glycosyltransferase family 2 protein [Lactococcus lactis subsp. lactis]
MYVEQSLRPFFSIIMPVYNVEKFVAESIDSVINQTFQDFELIIVDDGSTDGSSDICEDYARNYPDKIKLFHQKNQGLLQTRRNGLKKAIGNFIVHLDSDDCLRLDSLKKITEIINKTKCDLTFFDCSDEPTFSHKTRDFHFQNLQTFTGKEKVKLYFMLSKDYNFNNLVIKVAKREIYDIDKDYSQYGVANGEDLLQSLPLITNAKKIVYLKETLYYYRPNPESITGSYRESLYYEGKIVATEVQKYLKIWHFSDDWEFVPHLALVSRMASAILVKKGASQKDKVNSFKVITEDLFFRRAYRSKSKKIYLSGNLNMKFQKRIVLTLMYYKMYWALILIGKFAA